MIKFVINNNVLLRSADYKLIDVLSKYFPWSLPSFILIARTIIIAIKDSTLSLIHIQSIHSTFIEFEDQKTILVTCHNPSNDRFGIVPPVKIWTGL